MSVTVRNVVTSMRLMSSVDWTKFFESVSLVDEELRVKSNFAAMDFSTRDSYRHAIEELARGSAHTEIEIARTGNSSSTGRRRRQRELSRTGSRILPYLEGARPAFEKHLGFHVPLQVAD